MQYIQNKVAGLATNIILFIITLCVKHLLTLLVYEYMPCGVIARIRNKKISSKIGYHNSFSTWNNRKNSSPFLWMLTHTHTHTQSFGVRTCPTLCSCIYIYPFVSYVLRTNNVLVMMKVMGWNHSLPVFFLF